MIVDAIIDIRAGDCGKGAIAGHLAQTGSYDICLRFGGGHNCGHQVYLQNGEKVATHIIPSGSLFGLKGVIGPGCVVNERKFFQELEALSKHIPDLPKRIRIAHNANVVTEAHIEEELGESKIGTTRTGTGGAYRDRAARIGIRAESVKAFEPFLIDFYDELFVKNNPRDIQILAEGHQGMALDVSLTEHKPHYYCTSTAVGVGELLNNGIPWNATRDVIAVAKVYDTYVGAMAEFQDSADPILDKIGDLGMEFGSTTGRRRLVSYLNLSSALKYANIIGATQVIFKKLDILQQVGTWKLRWNNELLDLKTEEDFCEFIREKFQAIPVTFSSNPRGV